MDPSARGASLDSTPGLFDTQLFVEVQLRSTQGLGAVGYWGGVESPLVGEIRLESDAELARGSTFHFPDTNKGLFMMIRRTYCLYMAVVHQQSRWDGESLWGCHGQACYPRPGP